MGILLLRVEKKKSLKNKKDSTTAAKSKQIYYVLLDIHLVESNVGHWLE
jgi:hypothetical protein